MIKNNSAIATIVRSPDGVKSRQDGGSLRDYSYDLRIGRILDTDGTDHEKYYLKPQGIVRVFSLEKVSVPNDVLGYASVKTSLCDEGILPLNIGIVDPGYEGYLSSMLLNFSKEEYPLERGDVFLRVSFAQCEANDISPSRAAEALAETIWDATYRKDRWKKMTLFAPTFLNLEASVEKVTDPIFEKYKGTLITWLGVAGLALGITLALFPFLVTLGLDYAEGRVESKEKMKAEILEDIKKEQQTKTATDVEQLRRDIEGLKAEIKARAKE